MVQFERVCMAVIQLRPFVRPVLQIVPYDRSRSNAYLQKKRCLRGEPWTRLYAEFRLIWEVILVHWRWKSNEKIYSQYKLSAMIGSLNLRKECHSLAQIWADLKLTSNTTGTFPVVLEVNWSITERDWRQPCLDFDWNQSLSHWKWDIWEFHPTTVGVTLNLIVSQCGPSRRRSEKGRRDETMYECGLLFYLLIWNWQSPSEVNRY